MAAGDSSPVGVGVGGGYEMPEDREARRKSMEEDLE